MTASMASTNAGNAILSAEVICSHPVGRGIRGSVDSTTALAARATCIGEAEGAEVSACAAEHAMRREPRHRPADIRTRRRVSRRRVDRYEAPPYAPRLDSGAPARKI